MKITLVLGARSEWGYIKPVYLCAAERGHDVSIWACNTSVLPSYGNLSASIASQGFNIAGLAFTSFEGSTHYAMAKSVSAVASAFSDFIMSSRPDWVVLAGDRAEQLGAAIGSTFQYTPTAHIQAGERSGNIDGSTRHAIGRLVHVHFSSNRDASERLLRAGEEDWRIIETGAPQLDDLIDSSLNSNILEQLQIEGERVLVGIFHPVTTTQDGELEGLHSLLLALSKYQGRVIWIAPNNDAGGERVRRKIVAEKRAQDRFVENLDRSQFAQLLANAEAVVGNSSAGILEAPSFGLPCLNIGSRQSDRLRGRNVIDSSLDLESVKSKLASVLDPVFRASLRGMDSPYGDGRSASRIVSALEELAGRENLTSKRLVY